VTNLPDARRLGVQENWVGFPNCNASWDCHKQLARVELQSKPDQNRQFRTVLQSANETWDEHYANGRGFTQYEKLAL
jgi:hypothetical protein